MLKQFTIRNFKCYGKQVATFDLSRITFIYGNNSVGKSSFLDALEILDKAQRNSKGVVIRSDGFKNEQIVPGDEWGVFCVSHDRSVRDWKLACTDSDRWILVDRITSTPISESVYRTCVPLIDHIKAGESGERKVTGFDALAASLDDEDGILTPDQVNEVNAMFQDLGVNYACSVDNTLTDLDYNVANLPVEKVGTGIRGIYRYLKAIARWKTGILLLEEPEANVNENQLQGLARLLVNKAMDRSANDHNAQMVVECHSEHVLLEVLGMIADGKQKVEDFSVVYVQKSAVGSVAVNCKVDRNGALDRWPDANGFFTARKRILFGENDNHDI